MSNNAVLCVCDGSKTVRLSVYRCKPAVFLCQLEKTLTTIGNDSFDDIVSSLIENGFELEADSNSAFEARDMETLLLVNWAWLLQTDIKTLSYWDVTASLNGLKSTIEQDSISPLDHANWLAADAVADYESYINELKIKIESFGITINNF